MKCSLIISVYNDIKTLALIFEALKIQTEKDFEVIVADDGSGKEFVEKVKLLIEEAPFKAMHIWHEDIGWRKEVILNRAVESSSTEYLIFIDGDCIPHKKFIAEHLRFASYGKVVAGRRVMLSQKLTDSITPELIASGKMHSYILPRILWAGLKREVRHAEEAMRLTNGFLRHFFLEERWKDLLGCNFSIYKDDLLEINGFDERFTAPSIGEDTDVEARLNRIDVYVKVERHMLTVYHKYHKLNHSGAENNLKFFNENNENNISWTPYGIVKGNAPKREDE